MKDIGLCNCMLAQPIGMNQARTGLDLIGGKGIRTPIQNPEEPEAWKETEL